MLDDLLQRFRKRDRLALSRLVSLVARGEQAEAILAGVAPHPQPLSPEYRGEGGQSSSPLPGTPGRGAGGEGKPARVVAITGSGGVGKSTLAGKLVEKVRAAGQTVAVLACDPQSPLSGGALLGDRFRMPARPDDDGVFIRSLAAAGGHGALAEHLDALVRLLEAFGFDVVLIETVGAGQGDTVVRDLADVLVLLLQPETGDDLQWEKAGLFEVADIIVIHKADMPGAERVEAQVLAALGLSAGPPVPVLRVSARTGAGLAELWQTIARLPLKRAARHEGRDLLRLAQEALAARFAAAQGRDDPRLREVLRKWRGGELGATQAAAAVLELLGQGEPGV